MSILSIYRGDSEQIPLSFTGAGGASLILSGYTVYYTVRRTYADATPVIFKTITGFVSAASGLAQITLTTGDTTICVGDYPTATTLQDPSTGITTYSTDILRILPSPFVGP